MQALVGADYPKKVIPLINKAKKNINILIYNWEWIPDNPAHPLQQFNIAIAQAVQRGVIVRAVVNSKKNLEFYSKAGVRAKQIKDKRTLHSKLLIIDNEIYVIGSHNFSRNAFTANLETSVIYSNPCGFERLDILFNNLYHL